MPDSPTRLGVAGDASFRWLNWPEPALGRVSRLRTAARACRTAGARWSCVFGPAMTAARCYRPCMAYPLPAAQTHLGELVAEARQSHRPVTISEDGKPVAALINIDDLADLEDRAALAAHLADKAAGREGIGLDDLDAALDRIET
jgi:prevent-host-death family protein